MYYKDDFNVTFKEESAFYRYLDDVEKRAEWFRAQSKDLKTLILMRMKRKKSLLNLFPRKKNWNSLLILFSQRIREIHLTLCQERNHLPMMRRSCLHIL